MRILIGALSGWNMEGRRKNCQETWFPAIRALGGDAVFLMGSPEVPSPIRDGDLLRLPCPDPYDYLPQRTRWFCQWSLKLPPWDYLFKCDDDTYVCASRLVSYDASGRDYIGAEWLPGVGYASGGAGYFLSRRAAEIVAAGLTNEFGAEDLLVGKLLREAGIPFSIEPRLVPFGAVRRPEPGNDLITAHAFGADVFRQCFAECG